MAEKQTQKQKSPFTNRTSHFLMIALLVLLAISIIFSFGKGNAPRELTNSQFINVLDLNGVKTVDIAPLSGDANYRGYKVTGLLLSDEEYVTYLANDTEFDAVYAIITRLNTDASATNDVVYNYERAATYNWINILFPIILVAGIVIMLVFMMRGGTNANKQAFDFGKSRARLSKGQKTTFQDVAGADEEKEELREIIDFLKNPKKYIELGARIPKGVLLVGPPGTGKTLIARAVAGEASVPFYFVSGSDFLEMFVGVGASRVRDMFRVAKQNAPCILFIDEIDAVGRQRGTGLGGGHDEREQTLNQLLVEMDGFGHNSGVIVLAATNRVDILDPALMRPGRFDRQIYVSRPDIKGRVEILKVHSRKKKINPAISFEEIGRRTPGFTGADLENLMNEAALLAARENKRQIELYHIDEAVDRVMMGPAKKSRVFSKKERKIIAFHEAGHAVIGLKLENASIVHKVTIIPRGQAGGYNLMLPEEEQAFVQTKQSLLELITGLLGGRVAEEFTFNEISTGAHNDLQRATQIARAMITEYGMSENLGPVTYEHDTGAVFLGRDYGKDKNFSEAIATEIDKEIRGIIHSCYESAMKLISEHKELLNKIAHYLLEVETLTREDIDEIVKTGRLSRWDDILVSNTTGSPEEKTPAPESDQPAESADGSASTKKPAKESA
ncbi:MAG: ATP-dependent zinc metalloprotease FtsH [Candidatus Izemoplasmatales bacterium]|mgnify:CR=1 FL=1|nr:ATP-dependent zinc metalloprotease FtsH [Candidatus Izemoplasmatales bacterium]MDD4355244.1 ATP-dependent zinc metalloprotease FtsH [Candidatus Izemoplasmatales bacterium]MDD4988116.1 ATP-dependent zinc metalloprotease FtsH [Candidatus Izemoplasmatales bacterium]